MNNLHLSPKKSILCSFAAEQPATLVTGRICTLPCSNYRLPVTTPSKLQQTNERANQKRSAEMAIPYSTFQIKRPGNFTRDSNPPYITEQGVWAQEITPGIAEKDLVNWKLLTTHSINDVCDAIKIVNWYSSRWYIEQVFRLLKSEGFGIEDAQLETGWALRKLLLMKLSSLLKILQMNIAYSDAEEGQPIEEVFTEAEIKVLVHLNKTLQGKTIKTQNRNNPRKTEWATWVVGRLG